MHVGRTQKGCLGFCCGENHVRAIFYMTKHGDQNDSNNGTCIEDRADLDRKEQEDLTPILWQLETQRDQDEG